jgi:hypothetical protein
MDDTMRIAATTTLSRVPHSCALFAQEWDSTEVRSLGFVPRAILRSAAPVPSL